MKKYFLLIFFIFPMIVNAISKEDIIELTDNIYICDDNTYNLYINYKSKIINIINNKNISNDNLNILYNNVNELIDIANDYSICSIDSYKKLKLNKKFKIYNLLLSSYSLIKNSPNIDINNNNISNNSDTKDVFLINELNEVGYNNYFKYGFIVLVSLFTINIIRLFIYKKKRYFFISIVLLLFIILGFIFRNSLNNLINIISCKEIDNSVFKIDSNYIYPSYGEKYGKLFINNKSNDIYYGDDANLLSLGIGHNIKSYLPGEGGVIILSGHNSLDTMELLDNCDGDIVIETNYGVFTYSVYDKKVINANKVFSVNSNKEILILYTCYPMNILTYGNKRLVLYASLSNSIFY